MSRSHRRECLPQRLCGKLLAEENHVGLEDAVAFGAQGRLVFQPDAPEEILHGISLEASQALGEVHGAVKLEDFFRGIARLLVQVVDVLSDDAFELSEFLHLGYGKVGLVGLRVDDEPALDEKLPLLEARLGAREKTVDREFLGVETGPDPAGASKIGDARFRADSRPGENDDPFRTGYQPGCFLHGLEQHVTHDEPLPGARLTPETRRGGTSSCIVHFGGKEKVSGDRVQVTGSDIQGFFPDT